MDSEARLAVLEERMRHLEQKYDRTAQQVDEMHAILLQARGVKYAIWVAASFAVFISGIAGWFLGRH